VERVRSTLSGDNAHIDFSAPFVSEQALTEAIALGLRRVFSESFGVPATSPDLCHYVVYRKGGTEEDKVAWHKAQPDKWIVVQGRNFVPDVLIRRPLENPTEFLPIEAKLLKRQGYSQGLATAIGQSLIYRTRYPQSIMFVGVTRGAIECANGIVDFESCTKEDKALRKTLKNAGVSLIIRPVGR
jgi:hypothetical protein